MSKSRHLLDRITFEVFPAANVAAQAAALERGAAVAVTASPTRGMGATVDLCEQLVDLGHRAIPHLAARLVKTDDELGELVERLEGAGVTDAFVVGGDSVDHGEFADALALLRALDRMGHPFETLGVAGYPEGHPFIPDDRLLTALLAKQPFASYMVSQMCFDPASIGAWLQSRREAGVTLPLVAGVPGAVGLTRLLALGARIGVGPSLRYLRKSGTAMLRLLTPGVFTPDHLVAGLTQIAADPSAGLIGLHLYTFNQIEPTLEWLTAAREALA